MTKASEILDDTSPEVVDRAAFIAAMAAEGEDVEEYSLDDERLADGMGDEGDMSQGDEGELP